MVEPDRAEPGEPEDRGAEARIAELHAGGASLRAIAEALEAEGTPPPKGERWHPEAVRRVISGLDPRLISRLRGEPERCLREFCDRPAADGHRFCGFHQWH